MVQLKVFVFDNKVRSEVIYVEKLQVITSLTIQVKLYLLVTKIISEVEVQ